MSRKLLAALACAVLPSTGFAAVQQVGTCSINGHSYQHFETITSALASQPKTGSIIYLCPGIYAEQVTIVNPTNLIGYDDKTSSGAILVPPSSGLVVNAPSSDPQVGYAAQIAALAGAVTVNISNLTIDGTNNQIAGCAPILVGILFQNTGGTVQNNRLINQSLVNGSAGLGGCQSGNAIELLGNNKETVKVLNNDVSGFQKNGITVASVTATIMNNTVTGQGATPALAQNGIEADQSPNVNISQNTVSDVVYTGMSYGATGILIYDSPGAILKANTGTNTQGLIYDFSDTAVADDNPVISSNKVQATHTFDGIDVCGVTGATITGNTINGSDESAIHVDGECSSPSSATVMNNKVNGACVGILVGPNSSLGNSSSPNIFYNTITEMLTGADTCPSMAQQTPVHSGHHQGRRVVRIH